MCTPAMPLSSVIEIVLVEDNPRDAELIMRAFSQHQLANHVLWVKDGAEALDLFFGACGTSVPSGILAPKLVLLDLKLPKVDGHEVLRRLKTDPQTRGIPVVILTSSREEADILGAYQEGTNSYLVKPVEFDGFLAAVRQLGLYWVLLNQAPPLGSTSAHPHVPHAAKPSPVRRPFA